jgi:hypothetical protein
MSFEAVLGNKEFEFVVSEVTLTVVTWHSTSGGHGHRVSSDQGHVFFAKYILNLPYIYSIFSFKKNPVLLYNFCQKWLDTVYQY